MGAAIDVFDGARALRVPRRRFAPVKTTSDLLALRSDAYVLTDDAHVEPAEGRDGPPVVDLDDEHYKLLARLRGALPRGRAVARRVRAPDGRGRRRVRRATSSCAARSPSSTAARGGCASRTGPSSRADRPQASSSSRTSSGRSDHSSRAPARGS